MKSLLIVSAASVAAMLMPITSSTAQEFSGESHFRNGSNAPSERFTMRQSFPGAFAPGFGCDRRGNRHRDGRRNIAVADCAAFAAGFGYFDQDINRSWAPDSFNDWWNDRPDRAYPRWIYHNQN